MTLTYRGFAPQPPTCNTGVPITTPPPPSPLPQTPSLGWYRFTSRSKHLIPQLIEFWELTSGDKFELTPRGLFGYEESYRSAFGVSVNFSHDRPEFCADFRQSALGSVSLEDVHALLEYCDAYLSCKTTRMDCATDDYSQTITHENLLRSIELHRYRSHHRVFTNHASIIPGRGWTVSIGSRKSTSYLRIYDKQAESNLPAPCVRCEVELKAEAAQANFRALVDSKIEDWLDIFKGLMRSVVDFVDTEADSNISRCPLLEWWDAFVNDAIKFRLPTPEKPKTIERVFHWMQRQWIGTVAMLREIYGLDSLQEFIAQLSRDFDGKFSLAQRLIMEQELLPPMP